MREILFRGKRIGTGSFIYGYFVKIGKVPYIFTGVTMQHNHLNDYGLPCHSPERYPVYSKTVGQYTGHKDKNGTKIFEGDIVKRDFGEETIGAQFASVEYRDSIHGFTMNPRNDWMFTEFEDCEVIGNIYDNLVLMEVKKKKC